MKTYKQKYNELHEHTQKLQDNYYRVNNEKLILVDFIKDNNMLDPIAYKKIWNKLFKSLEALKAINQMEKLQRLNGINTETKSISEIISEQALYEIGELE